MILLSPIGATDPIRGYYDGPMLHIVRHYRPHTVYLYLTSDMEDHDRADDRYAACIKSVHPSCRIAKIYTGITDPHLFDRFIGLFGSILDHLATIHPGETILINLSSGTAQMMTALGLEAITSRYPLKIIQVTTPIGKVNTSSPSGKAFHLEEEMLCNEDENPVSSNRCREVSLAILRRNNARQAILSLIDRYEYAGALAQYEAHKSMLPPLAGALLAHASARSSLNLSAAKKLVQDCPPHLKLFPVQEAIPQRLTEYFMVMAISQKCGQLPDFILKITPFLFYLTQYYLEAKLRFPLADYTVKRFSAVLLSADKVMAGPVGMKQAFQTEFKSTLRDSELSFTNLVPIIQYLAQASEQEKLPDTTLIAVAKRLRQLRAYEKAIRNEVAHTINAIDESTFERTAKQLHSQDSNYSPSMTSARLLGEIKSAMSAMLGSSAVQYSFVYDAINQEIRNLLAK